MLVIESVLHIASLAAVIVFLALIFAGLARALRRPGGRTVGRGAGALRASIYVLIGVPFFLLAILGWRPLPIALSPTVHAAAVAAGALLYFPGLALAGWGRLALGEMYNVSLASGAQLFAGHRLITHGPYALLRHPMYAGLIAAAWGALLLYRTITCVFLAVTFLGFGLRARREEQALAAEFGPDWDAYRRRVPGWFPRRPA